MRKVLIKASYFVDTDLFQHVSQWEKAMMYFFAQRGGEMEKMEVLGSGPGELFYTIKKIQEGSIVAMPKNTEGLSKKLQQVKNQVNPSLKKNTKPLVVIKEDNRPRRIFNPGTPQKGTIRKISFNNQKPQGT